jgi:hypothetical protein
MKRPEIVQLNRHLWLIPSYLLTPWSRVILEKLTGLQLVKSQDFMEPEGSLPHSQVPATCLYSEPVQSNPYPHSLFPEDPP